MERERAEQPETNADADTAATRGDSAGAIFLAFLAFGARAFGGPAAQIGELSAEFVDERRWVTRERFRSALAIYQLLPGPEAHEMCCYLGAARGGRLGSVAAGLGFMLPGLALMLVACFAYASVDLAAAPIACAMAAMQLAAAALIVRAAWRLTKPLFSAGPALIAAMAVSCAIAMWWFAPAGEGTVAMAGATATSAATTATTAPAMFGHGLTAGLVTFGGAYTAIPYVATVATGDHGWMTRGELLDGVALASVLPAPLVIFGTFVGFRGAGLAGALAFTAGIFLPAFSFTLIGFGAIERLLAWKPARRALDLASAIAIGLIVGAALHIVLDALGGWPLTNLGATRFGIATPIAFAALVALVFRVRSHGAVPAIVVGAGVLGAAFGAISGGALAK